MPLELNWTDIAIRIALTIAGGGIIGLERGVQGRSAGLRTTLLVSLAAGVAMILANLLMIRSRQELGPGTTFDPLRLPLGVLSGMGFIGAGAILRREDVIHGVTTAATLWFCTVMGLCIGGGQLLLGGSAAVLGLIVLRGLAWVEDLIPRDRTSTLVVRTSREGPSAAQTRTLLVSAGYQPDIRGMTGDPDTRTITYEVSWRAPRTKDFQPLFLDDLDKMPGVISTQWTETPLH